MYRIKVEASFSAAHNLRQYKGKCESLHGHNWKVEAEARSPQLDAAGMVMDFKLLKARLRSVLERFDHTYINRIPYFRKVNPTSEHICKYIYTELKKKIPQISSVTVWENSTSLATYEE